MEGSRHEITFSFFDEKSGTYSEVTLPGNASYDTVCAGFERFVRSLGYMELTRPAIYITPKHRDGWRGLTP